MGTLAFTLPILCLLLVEFITDQTLHAARLTGRNGVKATSSSQWTNFVPERVIDNNPSNDAQNCRCCSATEIELNPWYQLDFGKHYTVRSVYIMGRNRTENDQHFQNLQIVFERINNSTARNVERNVEMTESQPIYLIDYNLNVPKSSQFVSVILRNATRHFAVCEIRVYGDCADGEYGETCNNVCHCKGDTCNKTTGVCPSGECLPGYHGQQCDKVCSDGTYGPGCKDTCGKCLGHNIVCDKMTGKCPSACKAVYQGNQCKTDCADGEYGETCNNVCHCKGDTCNKTTGVCPSGECLPGYHGQQCDKVCSDGTYGPGCKDTCGKCLGHNIVCDKMTGKCPSACKAGYQGDQCNTDCADGEYGETCNNVCHCKGDTCNKTTGVCPSGECLPGYHGQQCDKVCSDGTYGPGCKDTCGKCLGHNIVCDKMTGKCPLACKAGYQGDQCKTDCADGEYGETCNNVCHCKGDTCNKTTGVCPSGECLPGYHGQQCDKVCSDGTYGPGCKDTCGKCLGHNIVCDKMTGKCPSACKAGYQGDQCKTDCADGEYGETCNNVCHCKGDTCNKTTGVCPSGECLPGYHGQQCDKVCSDGTYGPGCKDTCGKCLGHNIVCDKMTGKCPSACKAGYQGDQCNTDCADGEYGETCNNVCHCKGDTCNKTTGVCPSGECLPGYHGQQCDKVCSDGTYGPGCKDTCGKCLGHNIVCDKMTGKCPSACKAGYQGDQCKTDCADGEYGETCNNVCHCKGDTCNKTTGVCPSGECLPGYHGQQCDKVCSDGTYGPGCKDTCGKCLGHNIVCDKMTGKCPSACKAGYQGDQCKTDCADGEYGETCNNVCHCKGDTCNKTTGVCPSGECLPGYHGQQCDKVCSDGTYGPGCKDTCGKCLGHNIVCDKMTGKCPSACKAGYQGDQCKTASTTALQASKIADILQQLQYGSFTANEALNLLANSTQASTLAKNEIHQLESVLEEIIDNLTLTVSELQPVTRSFMACASKLLKTSKAQREQLKTNNSGAETVINLVDRMLSRVLNIASNESIKVNFTSTEMYVEVLKEVECQENITFPNRKEVNKGPNFAKTICPGDANTTSFSGVIYNDIGELFTLQTDRGNMSKPADVLNRKSVQPTIISFTHPRFDGRVLINIKVDNQKYKDPECVFLDIRKNMWSNEGCKLLSYDINGVQCECNHLTNFAVLMSVMDVSVHENTALNVLSIVSCCISILCLLVTMVIHIVFKRKLTSTHSSKVQLLSALCGVLIFTYIIFLAGVNKTDNKVVCTAIAVSLHFSLLTVFSLMLAIGIDYMLLVVTPLHTKKLGIPMILTSFVCSAVIVGISSAATKLNGYGNDKACWLDMENLAKLAFIVPVCLVVCVNIGIVIVMFRALFNQSTMKKKTEEEKIRISIRNICILSPLFGFTWIIGIFAVNKETLVFQYIFVILNGFQGFLIMVCHCILDQKVRGVVRSRTHRRKMVLESLNQATNPPDSTQKSELQSTTEL